MQHNPFLTIGVLANWQLYDGTTAHRYLLTLLNGIVFAGRERNISLLLGCGVGLNDGLYAPAWPVPTPQSMFVPVGPWNCDGLVIVPPFTADARTDYVRELQSSEYPIVFAGAGSPGPTVAIDNATGILQAVGHLIDHGHRRIGFVGGHQRVPGDSAERRTAYERALQHYCVPFDPQLIVVGDHSFAGGKQAMRQLLALPDSPTAVVASNDISAFGALSAIHDAGLHVPDDVALIGFDDILDARIQSPPLTTIHNPTFALGYRSLLALEDMLRGTWDGVATIQVPTRLVIRRSCGCQAGHVLGRSDSAKAGDAATLAERMTEAALTEMQRSQPAAIAQLCEQLAHAFHTALRQSQPQVFIAELFAVLQQTEVLVEDMAIWQSVLSVLREAYVGGERVASLALANDMIDQARIMVSERIRRQTTHALVQHIAIADRVGAMTAQLLAVVDQAHIAATLAAHIVNLGITHVVAALYEPAGDDPVAWSTVALQSGLESGTELARFPSRSFPPFGTYPEATPWQIAVLPLIIDGDVVGFVAFDASNLDACAAIMRNLASAMRTIRLYNEAREGRRLAEDANRLKSRFLSMVSHELRTPLNLIVGLSDMVLREDTSRSEYSTDLRTDLEHIASSAQHLGHMIGDVLDLASSDAGQLRLVREPLDLATTLRMVADAGQRMAEAKGLRWTCHIPQHDIRVLGDQTRLRQIVFNLIGNAVKFTTQGEVELSVALEADNAIVRVCDSGLGIPQNDQAGIFDEFRRGEQSVLLGYRGLGLGLAICKQLVELHGGTIGVQSAGIPGMGSQFVVRLPLIGQPAPMPGLASFGERIVLLIADASQGALLEQHLQHENRRIDIQRGSLDQAGFATLLVPAPDAIICDQAWIESHGQFLHEAMQQLPQPAPPIFVCALDPTRDAGSVIEWQHMLKPLDDSHAAILAAATNSVSSVPTVLIVDDDEAMRALHRRIVQARAAAVQVLEAEHGVAALASMRAQRPDLVLLDLVMPELDGFGVLAAMQSDPALRDIPVIVLTAQVLTDSEIARMNRGVSAILAKGVFSASETLAHIETALNRRRRLGSVTQQLMHKALGYMHTHYAEALSREQIALHVGINENYLTDCFHREMGITPMNYLARYRIQQAQSLLEGEQSITEIALAVGFGDSAYFSRVFQREIGISPSGYRRAYRATRTASF